jgi:hypothetical protein
MNAYKITCEDGSEYNIIAAGLEPVGRWIKFWDKEDNGDCVTIALVSGYEINNIQLMNPLSGNADFITRVKGANNND